VSNTTKIGYREAFRHRFLHRTRAYAARDQYGRSKQPTKQYLDIVGRAYLVSIGNASSSGVDLSLKECCGWERRSAVGQTEKNSVRAYVFRSSPESGRCSIQSTLSCQQNGRVSMLLSCVPTALPDTAADVLQLWSPRTFARVGVMPCPLPRMNRLHGSVPTDR
jgi:hypothetical protein